MYIKKYEDMGFTDDFIFCKVLMNNPDLCKRLIEIILNRRIKKIVFSKEQESYNLIYDKKGIRLDVYCDDEDGTVYDLEMQTTDTKNLPKRARYYQGIIDLNSLPKGKGYESLKEQIIIFFCTFDAIGKSLPIYTFENRCKELPELPLGDETTKIFVNPLGVIQGMSEDFIGLCHYLQGKPTNNAFVKALRSEIKKALVCEEWRLEYMSLMIKLNEAEVKAYSEGHAAGHAAGHASGLEEGRMEGELQLLFSLVREGIISVDLAAQKAHLNEAEFVAKMNATKI